MYHNVFLLKIRSITRKIGLNKIIGKLLLKNNYEELFNKALLADIKENDIIYDVGANQGFYTKKFLEISIAGKVFAFEPIPDCVKNLRKLENNFNNLIVNPIAIGSKSGAFPMSIGEDMFNTTSSLKLTKDHNDIMVNVDTIDNIVKINNSVPNIIKIDVEGYELEVLNGMVTTLKKMELQLIAIEIHFRSMELRGYKNGPKSIIKILRDNGFKINWTDSSHIIAKRGR